MSDEKQIDDGGSAFPNGAETWSEDGMSLRDWFAGQEDHPPDWWMTYWENEEILNAQQDSSYIKRSRIEAIAQWRWEMADAMLRARQLHD